MVLVTKLLTHVLPAGLAHEIDDESEALPIAVLFCAYVQFLRAPWADRRREVWLVSGLLAAGAWAIAWLLLTFSLPAGLVTLNESFVAVGAMILYACPSRPIRHAALLTGALLVVAIALSSTSFITSQAESVVPIVLAPLALDWADRMILQPSAASHHLRRLSWCLFLVIVPLVARAHISVGSHHDVLQFERRATEGFLGLLLVHLFFSYWLGDRWATGAIGEIRPARADAEAASGRPAPASP